MQARIAPGRPAPAHQPARPAQLHGGRESFDVDPARLGLARGGGSPLPQAVLAKMEAAFEADFSQVRVHVGPQASRIGAIAFTTGNDIYFAPGRYVPESVQGQQLLGHELAHVIQQRNGRVATSGNGVSVVQDFALEAEADRLGMRAAAYRSALQAKPATPFVPRSAQMRPGARPEAAQRKLGPPPAAFGRSAAPARGRAVQRAHSSNNFNSPFLYTAQSPVLHSYVPAPTAPFVTPFYYPNLNFSSPSPVGFGQGGATPSVVHTWSPPPQQPKPVVVSVPTQTVPIYSVQNSQVTVNPFSFEGNVVNNWQSSNTTGSVDLDRAMRNFGKPQQGVTKTYMDLAARIGKGGKNPPQDVYDDLLKMLQAIGPLSFANTDLGKIWQGNLNSYGGSKTGSALYSAIRSKMTASMKDEGTEDDETLNDLMRQVTGRPFEVHHMLYKSLFQKFAVEIWNLVLAERSAKESRDGPGQHELFHLVASGNSTNKFAVMHDIFEPAFRKYMGK
ncbi:DUF4157 domain-containing protein [Sphingomonas sp. DG1-23]|uniref:DUF4157 domain-containing protein n=1 Tax=Sphingomonas sp. DG1-23 TaxID=3068316 RepID=UPI00273E85EF|nr:DUF4157 domain-containing protein [Sphingomonas sp. DG1-23]MDP5280612.1 DUF4157 domain-containing protein [Sphingomonas sp. DG1-23]